MHVDRYVFMYVHELYMYVKNLISDLGLDLLETIHDLEHEILMS